MTYKIKQVSDIAGVSVRTLQYYDKIGLLKPSFHSESGYRIYKDGDLIELQEILFLKELDFTLKEIQSIISDSDFDREGALKSHKSILIEKRQRLDRIIKSVDRAITDIEGGIEMDNKEVFDAFDSTDIENMKKKYEKEVREKYLAEVVEESFKKTAGYSKEDWKRVTDQGDEIFRAIGAVMGKGAEDAEVQKLVGKYREYISNNFYECTMEIFAGLGKLYVADERFTKNIDKHGAGLAEFMCEAIGIYCESEGK